MLHRVMAGLVLSALLLSACSSASESTDQSDGTASTGGSNSSERADQTGETDAQPSPIPLVVDTDMGIDDVRALMWLAQDPKVDLIAVTVAGGGLARCPTGAANARAILDAIGRTAVPVSCGARGPLVGFNLAPTAWRDASDALAGMNLTATSDFGEDDAPQLLVETILNAPAPVTVLTLGPLTNLATAIDLAPTLTANIERLVVMGGAIEVGGNTLSFANSPVAEFNIWFDPVAADRVFSTDLDITLVPLDATNEVPITPLLYQAVAATTGDESVATGLLRDYMAENPLAGGLYHWDDLAAAVLLNVDIVTIEQRQIRVDTNPGPGIGQTVADPAARSVRVAMSADRDSFERDFAAAFGLAELSTSGYTADATVTYDGAICSYEGPDPLPAELVIEVTNTSSQSILGVSAGVYDPGTTAEALLAYEASNPTGPPSFLTLNSIAPLPATTTSYWRFENPPSTTLSCLFDIGSGVELAGPKLVSPD